MPLFLPIWVQFQKWNNIYFFNLPVNYKLDLRRITFELRQMLTKTMQIVQSIFLKVFQKCKISNLTCLLILSILLERWFIFQYSRSFQDVLTRSYLNWKRALNALHAIIQIASFTSAILFLLKQKLNRLLDLNMLGVLRDLKRHYIKCNISK